MHIDPFFLFRSLRLSLLSLLLAYFSSTYLTSLTITFFPSTFLLPFASTFCTLFHKLFHWSPPKIYPTVNCERFYALLTFIQSDQSIVVHNHPHSLHAPWKKGKLEKSSVSLPFLGNFIELFEFIVVQVY